MESQSAQNPLLQLFERVFPDRYLLTIQDVCHLLHCTPKVVYNWSRRLDPKRRPPRFLVGREVRFDKYQLADWLNREQGLG